MTGSDIQVGFYYLFRLSLLRANKKDANRLTYFLVAKKRLGGKHIGDKERFPMASSAHALVRRGCIDIMHFIWGPPQTVRTLFLSQLLGCMPTYLPHQPRKANEESEGLQYTALETGP